jgi:deazaflavin-dependent oxidoreductase (nitroreductase family)
MQIALTTTGRKSGRPHPVTLYAFEDQGRLIVVGSYGGAANDPDWVVNLRAHPRVQVRRDGRQDEVKAEEVTGPDRERVWQLVTAVFRCISRISARPSVRSHCLRSSRSKLVDWP